MKKKKGDIKMSKKCKERIQVNGEYLELAKNIKVINNDCLKVMQTIPDKTVDVIVLSYDFKFYNNLEYFKEVCDECKRIIKINGIILGCCFDSYLFNYNKKVSKELLYEYIENSKDYIFKNLPNVEPLHKHPRDFKLLLTNVKKDSIVFDTSTDSGGVAIACALTEMQYIGIEENAENNEGIKKNFDGWINRELERIKTAEKIKNEADVDCYRLMKKNEKYEFSKEKINKGLSFYTRDFEDKIIMCNCNDIEKSAFWEFFYNNFEKHKLKKIIAVYSRNGNDYKMEYDGNEKKEEKIELCYKPFESDKLRYRIFTLELIQNVDIVVSCIPFYLKIDESTSVTADLLLLDIDGNRDIISINNLLSIHRCYPPHSNTANHYIRFTPPKKSKNKPLW